MNPGKYPVLVATRIARILPRPAAKTWWRVFELSQRQPMWRLDGETRTGERGRMLVTGESPHVDYLPQRFFAGAAVRTELRPQGIRGLRRRLLAEAAAVDWVVARVDRWAARAAAPGDFLRVPHRVGALLSVASEPDLPARASESLAADLRAVRNHGFSATPGDGAQDVLEFYDTMYRPTVERRHHELGILKPRHAVRHAARQGGLLWIRQHGEKAGALVFRRRAGELELYAIGQRPTADGRPWRGADAAAYFFLVETARRLGCSRIDFGGCRPSLHDGGLRYKRKWGMRVIEHRGTHHDLLVHWTTVTPAIAGLLEHTSLIFRHDGGFAALGGWSGAPVAHYAMPGVDAYFRARTGARFGDLEQWIRPADVLAPDVFAGSRDPD